MAMDPDSTEIYNYINSFNVEAYTFHNGFEYNVPSPDLNFMNMNVPPIIPPEPDPGLFDPSITVSSDGSSFSASESYSPPNDSDSTDPVLKYISQMLMEENMEDTPYMFNDYLALEDTEKSLYEVIGEEYYPSMESPNSNLSGSNGHSDASISTNSGTSNYIDRHGVGEVGGAAPYSLNSGNRSSNMGNGGLMESSVSELLVKNIFSDKESMLQFKRGFEEASKFIPSSEQLIIDLESSTFSMGKKGDVPKVVVKMEKEEREVLSDELIGRKNHERDDWELEDERSNKQLATYTDESDLAEAFDKVLLCSEGKAMCGIADSETVQHGETDTLPHKEQSNVSAVGKTDTLPHKEQTNGSAVGKTRSKRQGKKKEMVDLSTLLILCAQAVSADDRRTAGELLKHIKEHSSHLGDATQRLAYFFANGLEARLDGSGALIHNFYTSLAVKRATAADILKAYKTHLCACPFTKLAIFFSNKTICHMSQKASALHIVDFGILYGFQWPILIQNLSKRPGGPPKLRITGIEIPQRGFRPAERIEETGRRLAKYCERFNVPFEYNPIAVENWETIQIEDIKINSNEVLAINSLFRFRNLLDEIAEVDCPRNVVLKLISKMKPNIFVNSIVNGAYNAPFFVTRFKEALFHMSAMFDVFENTLSREEPSRLMFEREFYGREAMNVIACEGSARVQRPETYKQWQVRMIRAGFKPLQVNQELMKIVRGKLKAWYHKDFVIDEDNNWMLQGWKGRILYGSSCWIPA